MPSGIASSTVAKAALKETQVASIHSMEKR